MKREYLLRGMLLCGCGHDMVATMHRYYCTARNHTNSPDKCDEPSVNGRLIEPLTWDYVMGLITDSASFEQRLREAQAQELHGMRPKQTELEHVDALIRQTEMEADEIARAITKTKGLVASKLEQQALEIGRRFQALSARKLELQEALKLELTDHMIENLMQFREVVTQGLGNLTFDEKSRWLELLQVRVTATDEQAVISCRLHRSE